MRLAELDRLAGQLHARVVTQEALDTTIRLAYEKGLGASAGAAPLDVKRLAEILRGDIGTRVYFFGAAYGHPVDESWEKIGIDFAAEYARLSEGTDR